MRVPKIIGWPLWKLKLATQAWVRHKDGRQTTKYFFPCWKLEDFEVPEANEQRRETMKAHIEVRKAKNKEWFFRAKAANGKILAHSETYKTRAGALKGVNALIKAAKHVVIKSNPERR